MLQGSILPRGLRALGMLAVAAVALAALRTAPARAQAPEVLVTIQPQAAIVRAVAPEAHVTVMIPPGASPHLFEPRPSRMVKVARADLYFTIGLELESAWVPKFLSANPDLRVVAMDAGVPKLSMAAHAHGDAGHDGEGHEAEHHEQPHHEGTYAERYAEHHGVPPHEAPDSPPHGEDGHHGDGAEAEHHAQDAHGDHHADSGAVNPGHDADRPAPRAGAHGHSMGVPDPHVWLSPHRARLLARNVRDALSAADPGGAEAYAANCAAFEARAEALSADIRALFEGLPSRRFLVFHPSWGYFADEFGLTQMAIESGGSEPGPRELAALVEEAREHGVSAVFVAPQFSRSTARVVADAIGGDLVEADPMATDWADNLRGVAKRLAAAMREGR